MVNWLQELVAVAGVRVVKVLLWWLEGWLVWRVKGVRVAGRSGSPLYPGFGFSDGRLARVREAHRLVSEL
jgi:hypothetical protein